MYEFFDLFILVDNLFKGKYMFWEVVYLIILRVFYLWKNFLLIGFYVIFYCFIKD